jgi:NAD(P)-dependent dehydrogenase (short-subunit alcohol dehydrogenase family)
MNATHDWPQILAGRSAVVTGGANGIGAAVVRALGSCGVEDGVVLDLEAAFHRRSPDGWLELPVDLRDDAAVEDAHQRVRDHLGTVDVLVMAAGIVPLWSSVTSLDADTWDEVFRVNVRAMLLCLQHLVPAMPAGASVVAIGSDNSWRGNGRLAGYVASKHAVLGLVRSAALDLGGRAIRVNAVAPGPIATDAHLARMHRRERELGIPISEALKAAASMSALGRMATEDEVAAAVVFLASDLASGVDGQLLRVDAGEL